MTTKSEYRKYVQSEWWQNRRRKFLADWGASCDDCGMPRWLCVALYDQDMHVDHRNYQNLGAEKDVDLRPLCPRCHDLKHKGSSALLKLTPPPCEKCSHPVWGEECISCRIYHHMDCQIQNSEQVARLEKQITELDEIAWTFSEELLRKAYATYASEELFQ